MVPNAPSQTAEAVCLMRATEQRRPLEKRIVDDPHAKLFLGRLSRAALASWEVSGTLGDLAERLSPGLTTYVLTRHRFIDDHLREALAGDIQQVVVLGAGYDSRAWRFAGELAGRPVFEVDFPATSRRKARLVAGQADRLPRTDVRRVEIDFERESLPARLRAAGFRTGARTFVVWEGVSMYLTRTAVKATLATVREITAAGSGVAMDFWYLLDAPGFRATAYRMSANLLSLLGEPVTFAIHPEDAGPFLERLDYDVRDLADAAELKRRYVRDRRPVMAGNYLVHAVTVDGAPSPARSQSGTRRGHGRDVGAR